MEKVQIKLYCIKNLLFKEKLFISFCTNVKVILETKAQIHYQQNTSGTIASDVALNCFSLGRNREKHALHFCPSFWNPSSIPAMLLEKTMLLFRVHHIEWWGQKIKKHPSSPASVHLQNGGKPLFLPSLLLLVFIFSKLAGARATNTNILGRRFHLRYLSYG